MWHGVITPATLRDLLAGAHGRVEQREVSHAQASAGEAQLQNGIGHRAKISAAMRHATSLLGTRNSSLLTERSFRSRTKGSDCFWHLAGLYSASALTTRQRTTSSAAIQRVGIASGQAAAPGSTMISGGGWLVEGRLYPCACLERVLHACSIAMMATVASGVSM